MRWHHLLNVFSVLAMTACAGMSDNLAGPEQLGSPGSVRHSGPTLSGSFPEPEADIGPEISLRNVKHITLCQYSQKDKIRLRISGNLQIKREPEDSFDGRVLRIVEKSNGQFIDTLTRLEKVEISSDTFLPSHGYFEFSFDTDTTKPFAFYLMAKGYSPLSLDQPQACGLQSTSCGESSDMTYILYKPLPAALKAARIDNPFDAATGTPGTVPTCVNQERMSLDQGLGE